MVLPPGPITCLLACTRSCAKERRVPNYALHPERCAAILLNCWLSHSLLHICCMCVWGGSGRLRASTVGLNIKTGCIPAWSGMAWTWKDMLLLQFLTEKAWGGQEKELCLLPLLSQLRYLPFFSATLLFFFLFFFSVFSADLCLTERVRVNSQEVRTSWDEYDPSIFTQTDMRTLNMYSCHWWTMA